MYTNWSQIYLIWSLVTGVPDAVLPQDGGAALQLAARADPGRRALGPAGQRARRRPERHGRRIEVGTASAAAPERRSPRLPGLFTFVCSL